MRLVVTRGTEALPVEVEEAGPPAGRFRVLLGGAWLVVETATPPGGPTALRLDGAVWPVDVTEADGGQYTVTVGGTPIRLRVEEPGRGAARPASGARPETGAERLVAPMPGRVIAVHVRAGDRVEPGAPLVVLEAMKMENEFRAATAGVVREVAVAAGQAVNAGDLLVVIGPTP
jgi:3-methylcrotonyl-CoA carboxylase alpha subunit